MSGLEEKKRVGGTTRTNLEVEDLGAVLRVDLLGLVLALQPKLVVRYTT